MRPRAFGSLALLALTLAGCFGPGPYSYKATKSPAKQPPAAAAAAEPAAAAAQAPPAALPPAASPVASPTASPAPAAPVVPASPVHAGAPAQETARELPAPAPIMALALTPAKSAAAPASPTGPERYVSLNFDGAEISVVIQTIAELLHLNYIVSPTVRGRISIQTSEKLPVSALLPVLEQILEVNGFMALKSGDFYKIVPVAQAKQESVETLLREQAPSVGSSLVTRIVPLRFISPGEVIKILTPFKTPAGIYQGHEPARLLFLTETPAKIAELLKIVEVLDVDTFASIQVELYPVRYAAVEDLARELGQVVTQVFSAAGRGRTLFRIIPVPQASAIMVFSGEPGLIGSIREWIGKLDQPANEPNERIFVYSLSHATAETLAAVLEKVFRRDEAKSQSKSASAPTAAAQNAGVAPAAYRPGAAPGQPPPAAPAAPAQPIAAGGSAAASGGASVVVVADKDTNSLIVQTAAWFYPTVEEMIRKLDAMPKQVLIEVLIAEITLDDSNSFGLSWAFKGQGPLNILGERHDFTNSVGSSLGEKLGNLTQSPNGLSVLLTEANRITAVLNAYAHDSKLNILSAPHILATNNKEAKIDVGSEIPILKTQVAPGSVTNGTTNANDVEYRSTGVILTVTPHINDGGFVTLEVQQEVSEAQTALTTSGINSPTIRKRMAKTTMVVKDNQTLVVGGLIQEKRDKSRDGLPWLSRIPIIGVLFGSTSATVTKTELVVLITPRVVNSVEDGDRLTRQVRDRVLTLKQGLEQFPSLERKVAP
jgi:general secretion pathway protein D